MQRSLLIMPLLFLAHQLSAQTATGSWFGKADVEMAGVHNNYLTELVIKQKGNRVEGIFGYYFKDKYQSFFVHGRFNPETREVVIENIPVIYFNTNSTVNSVECPTTFRGVLMNSRVKSTLKGKFYRDERYKYTCPNLSVTYTLDRGDQRTDSVIGVAKAGEKIWKPQADDVVVEAHHPAPATKPAEKKPAVAAADKRPPGAGQTVANAAPPAVASAAPVVASTAPAQKAATPSADPATNQVIPKPAIVQERIRDSLTPNPISNTIAPPDPTNPDVVKITDDFSKRKSVLNQTLDVESDSLRVSFYDNGEIDGDSISVFVNRQPVLTHQELAARALTLYLHLDSTLEINELSMFAENLGRIPPNTALMVVTDGQHRYEIFMSSSLTENATIKLRRKNKTTANNNPGQTQP